uniref:CSON014651 protein n=1 Tax=Culicoides sonorensis TaxID=179676 RepID=A0A336MB53_CULSO
MSEASPDDMWTPFKHLQSVVESYLSSNSSDSNLSELEVVLRKHKQNFTTLLKNPPKNSKSREEIRQGITDGINLPGLGHTILSKDLVDESIIISDMYDVNEFIALELLCTAQQQMPNHPGLPRGLVAILLYYDGRKALVTALKELMQARSGVSWCTDASQEVTQFVTNYTDGLVADGLLDKIIELLEKFDVSKEVELLSNNRALGPPKHHRQVLDLFEDIRVLLATCLFNYSAQSGLPRETVLKLIKHLSKYKPSTAIGGVGDVTLALQMALMYATDLSVMHRHEDGEEIAKSLPIVKDSEFIETVLETLSQQWECEGLRSLAMFSFGLAIATLRLPTQNIFNNPARISDNDEMLVDAAIQGKVFDFIHYTLLENEQIFKVEFYYRRMHLIFTDFIELMHSKVTELRARADETARTVQAFQAQGVEPPTNLCHNFETLLLAVGKLYENDYLGLNLSLEYWGPSDAINTSYHRSSTRSVCLFKFIRLAGELLPPILFVPYLKMLAGLSSNPESARNAFNLLKQGSGTSGNTTISWDHFFNSFSKYYANLRQEQNPGTETIYRSRALNRSISPEEIAGLQAVLKVLQAVATHDEVARSALCEHPGWAPLHILLGLVGSSIIIPLKTDLVLALAALAKSKETALQLWANLEASQIIVTIPTTAAFSSRGIESEIEEIESRNEYYPLTLAVLDLLYNLSNAVIPRNLGAGTRRPGLDPYLTFIINSVFLRFYSRNYKNVGEKWAIAAKTLKILDMYLRTYEINPADFPVQGQTKEENPLPGFHILLQMHTKSDFLRLLLLIIDESCTLFESYAPFPGKKHLEEASKYALNILERALHQQEVFFEAHFTSNCSILLSGLNKLLLGVNPRSGKPDHLLNVTKFVTFNSWLPTHSLLGIKILTHVIRQPNVNSYLLGLFLQNEKTKLEVRHGFVECLENDVVTETLNQGDDQICLKEAVINLLQDSLPQSAPNLAQYLLGFDVTKDIRNTRLQQPGILDFPSNCTKSLINLLDTVLENQDKNLTEDIQRLYEKAYILLYALCFDPRTSDIMLRFLRSCNDFLGRHISGLPFANTKDANVLSQMSHLLKCVSIELKQTAASNQITIFGNLCKILLGVVQNQLAEPSPLELSQIHSSLMGSHSIMETPSRNKRTSETKLLLCLLLDSVSVELSQVEKPKWDFFDGSMLQGLIKSCEVSTKAGKKLINVKKLHDILRDEINSVQSTLVVGHLNQILVEMEQVLDYALATTSNTVLMLLVNLRTCYSKTVHSTLDATLNSTSNHLSVSQLLTLNGTQTATVASPRTNTLSLKFILRNIIEWIIVSGLASQRLRINLYASLLNFMHIVKGTTPKEIIDHEHNDEFVSRLDKSVIVSRNNGQDNSDQMEMTIDVLASYGDKLVDILSHDCIGGHDVCKMLALSCIDMLLDLDPMSNFVQFISRRGYLTNLIESLLKIDNQLCKVLDVKPDTLKALYVYESKMAMLSRVAGSHIGAELLLEHKILSVLASMKVFDLHPDFQVHNYLSMTQDNTTFIPPVESRYQQILFPALSLCNVILTTLGTENHSTITQIIYFLLSHSDMIEVVLRAGTPLLNIGLLKELAAITCLIARINNQEISNMIDPQVNQDLGAHLYRLQKLMMTLFPRFVITDKLLKDINQIEARNNFGTADEVNKALHLKYVFQIASNLALSDPVNLQSSSPSLGVVVSQLRYCVDYYNKEKSIYDGLVRQKSSISNLTLDPNTQIQASNLNDRLNDKHNELKYCVFIIEHCLYLLWAHLDFYMLKAVGFNETFGNELLLTAEPGGWKVTGEDISRLKENLVQVITETFCKQLINTTAEGTTADKGYVEALLRRIKRLIQFVPVK